MSNTLENTFVLSCCRKLKWFWTRDKAQKCLFFELDLYHIWRRPNNADSTNRDHQWAAEITMGWVKMCIFARKMFWCHSCFSKSNPLNAIGFSFVDRSWNLDYFSIRLSWTYLRRNAVCYNKCDITEYCLFCIFGWSFCHKKKHCFISIKIQCVLIKMFTLKNS